MRRKHVPLINFDAASAESVLLRNAGSNDIAVARLAQRELAIALQEPLRQGILEGDIVGSMGIFTPIQFQPGQQPEFPLDFVVPGTESEYSAYTIPNYGRIPEKHIEGDYVTIPTYDVGAAIDWAIKFARDARWDIVQRAMMVLQSMFVYKMNRDAWRCLIGAGVDRNLVVEDANAPAGFLTKRLVSLMKLSMRRSGGGNLQSLNQIKLTDMFLSPEGLEDVRGWDLTQIDDVTRRQIFIAQDEGLSNIFGIDLHPLDELGEDQSLQDYFESLGGSLGSDLELAVGLAMNDVAGSSFVMPVRENVQIFEDETLHRQRRVGYYGWQEHGFGVLDNRRIMFGTY